MYCTKAVTLLKRFNTYNPGTLRQIAYYQQQFYCIGIWIYLLLRDLSYGAGGGETGRVTKIRQLLVA
jgi:hypothetical protein